MIFLVDHLCFGFPMLLSVLSSSVICYWPKGIDAMHWEGNGLKWSRWLFISVFSLNLTSIIISAK